MIDKSNGPARRDEESHRRRAGTSFITFGVLVSAGVLFFIIGWMGTVPRGEDIAEKYDVVAHYPILEEHDIVARYPIDEDAVAAQFSRRDRAQIVASGFKAADHLIVAVGALAEERGLTYAALKTKPPVDPELRARIGKLRQVSDEAFDDVLRLMQTKLQDYGQHASSTQIDRLRSLLDVERRRIDAGLMRSDPGVDVDLSIRWFQTTTRVLDKASAILQSVHQDIRSNSSQDVEASLQLQHLALLMTEYAGRERAIVSGAISRQTNLDDDLLYRALPTTWHHVDIRWKEAKALARFHSLSPALIQLMSEIDRLYFAEMKATRKLIEQASKTKSPYPISSEQWFQQITAAIDRMLKLGRGAGEFALEKLSGEKAREG